MKRLFIYILASLLVVQMYAEKYSVVAVTGDVYYYANNARHKVAKNQVLDDNSVVMVKYKSSLLVKGINSEKRYRITRPGKSTLHNLIVSEKADAVAYGEQYIDYVADQVSGKVLEQKHSDPATVRREIDSVTVSSPTE